MYMFSNGYVTYSVSISCKRTVLDPLEYNNKSNQKNLCDVTLQSYRIHSINKILLYVCNISVFPKLKRLKSIKILNTMCINIHNHNQLTCK